MAGFAAVRPSGLAVQQIEALIRSALFKSGAQVVDWLLQQAADSIDASYQPKPGEQRKGRESIEVQCLFGSFTLKRDYYYHAGKRRGHYPADAALGLEGGYTPALARVICLEGADECSYQKAEHHLWETGGIGVSARQIQRVVQRVGAPAQHWQERQELCSGPAVPVLYVSADATGVPMRKEELVGRRGKQADGSATTRMPYLGCVFTQHGCDEAGHPLRDFQSTTYLSTFGCIDAFGPSLRREALRRGMSVATEVVLLVDGAEALAHMGKECFATATQIVDFYHALEHSGRVVAAQLGSKEHPEYKQRLKWWAKQLLTDKVAKAVQETRRGCASLSQAAAVEDELTYFERNVSRMQYGTFRKKQFFIGSGVVEAGCKTIIGSRCKQSGMFWGEKGAQNVLALRCIHASRRTDTFWKHRLDSHAARNDVLALTA